MEYPIRHDGDPILCFFAHEAGYDGDIDAWLGEDPQVKKMVQYFDKDFCLYGLEIFEQFVGMYACIKIFDPKKLSLEKRIKYLEILSDYPLQTFYCACSNDCVDIASWLYKAFKRTNTDVPEQLKNKFHLIEGSGSSLFDITCEEYEIGHTVFEHTMYISTKKGALKSIQWMVSSVVETIHEKTTWELLSAILKEGYCTACNYGNANLLPYLIDIIGYVLQKCGESPSQHIYELGVKSFTAATLSKNRDVICWEIDLIHRKQTNLCNADCPDILIAKPIEKMAECGFIEELKMMESYGLFQSKNADRYIKCMNSSALSGQLHIMQWIYPKICSKTKYTRYFKHLCESLFLTSYSKKYKNLAIWLYKVCKQDGILINVQARKEYVFRYACKHNDFDMIKWLIQHKQRKYINIHAEKEHAFRSACSENNLEMAKYLYDWSIKIGSPIDIHALSENAFYNVCKYGYINVAKYLYKIAQDNGNPIDIHVENDRTFKAACANGQFQIIKWFYTLPGAQPFILGNIHNKRLFGGRIFDFFNSHYTFSKIRICLFLVEHGIVPIDLESDMGKFARIWRSQSAKIILYYIKAYLYRPGGRFFLEQQAKFNQRCTLLQSNVD